MTRNDIGFPIGVPAAAMPFPPPASPSTSSSTMDRSPWHSPVPCLFGGLAAMLGLIALVLLILACSYWKASGYPSGGDEGEVEDGNGNPKAGSSGPAKGVPVLEEKVLVIMAGEVTPTFLATPVLSTAGTDKLKAPEPSTGDDNKNGYREVHMDGV